MNEPEGRRHSDPQSTARDAVQETWELSSPRPASEVDEAPPESTAEESPFEEEPLALEPPAPVVDPWSKPAAPRSLSAAPLESPSPRPLPKGWEWSRAASPAYERPADTEAFPTAAEAPAPVEPLSPAPPRTGLERLGLDLLAIALALIGGVIGLIGAFFQELQSGVGILLTVVAAPIIEEALKPGGIYLLLVQWPQALRGRLHTALLCAISGAVFGVIESYIYVEYYYPDGNDDFVLFRFTVTPIMHAVASFIVGWGLTRALIDWANGKRTLPKMTRNCFIAGMGLHAAYNLTVVVLGAFGVMDFLET